MSPKFSLSMHQVICDLFHLGQARIKERAVCRAKLILPTGAVAATTTATDRKVRTDAAGLISAHPALHKRLSHIRFEHLSEGILSNVSDLPFIETVKIAGINVPVALHDELTRTKSVCRTHLGRISAKNADPVVKVANGNVLSRLKVRRPKAECLDQELAVRFGFQRVLLAFVIKTVEARDKL